MSPRFARAFGNLLGSRAHAVASARWRPRLRVRAGGGRGREPFDRIDRYEDSAENVRGQCGGRIGPGGGNESANRMNRPSGRIGDPNDSAIRTNRTRASPASGVGGGSLAGS